MSDMAFKWIESFALGGDMSVIVNNAMSKLVSVTSGVPQGS